MLFRSIVLFVVKQPARNGLCTPKQRKKEIKIPISVQNKPRLPLSISSLFLFLFMFFVYLCVCLASSHSICWHFHIFSSFFFFICNFFGNGLWITFFITLLLIYGRSEELSIFSVKLWRLGQTIRNPFYRWYEIKEVLRC